ncbi:MAG: hypothetical protein AB1473_01280 [Thermodesulfobacteriota bacterium]
MSASYKIDLVSDVDQFRGFDLRVSPVYPVCEPLTREGRMAFERLTIFATETGVDNRT